MPSLRHRSILWAINMFDFLVFHLFHLSFGPFVWWIHIFNKIWLTIISSIHSCANILIPENWMLSPKKKKKLIAFVSFWFLFIGKRKNDCRTRHFIYINDEHWKYNVINHMMSRHVNNVWEGEIDSYYMQQQLIRTEMAKYWHIKISYSNRR